jgi:glycosyltransferase involved in cell wall biosynthesis
MRVTFVLPPPNLSGGIRVLAIYAERLRRRGHAVFAVAPMERAPTVREMARAVLKQRRWPFRRKRPSHFDGLGLPLHRLPHPAPVIDSDLPDADVVVATWWETAEWVSRLSPAKGAKVHFMQDYEVWFAPIERLDATCRLPFPKIVLTHWMRDLLREKFGREPLAVIPNSVDTWLFNASPRSRHSPATVGTMYSPSAYKGCDVCIRAVEIARGELPALRFRVMGNSRPLPSLPLPRSTDFTLQARDRQLRDVYAACDVWLFGSRQEGFGLPVLEAMACRTPVIATPAGAAPDILKKGGGMLVPHDSPEAMAREIVRICSLPELAWRELSANARRAVEGYTWDDATDGFEEALHRVAASTERVPLSPLREHQDRIEGSDALRTP